MVGETDSRTERLKSGSITFQNVISTIYHILASDPGAVIIGLNGRPQFVLDDRQPIAKVVA